MLRHIFVFIVSVHGLIHLLGFVKEWKLAPVKELTGKTLLPISNNAAKAIGILWLLACILLLVAAVLFFLKTEYWWMLAILSVLLSQSLIVLYWQDAKFGTIANVIVLGACILAYGNWRFNNMVVKELNTFLPHIGQENPVVTRESIAGLPPVVQKWLVHSDIVGKEITHTVHLRQKGEMRSKPEGGWMPFEAEQYFTVDKPGFLWKANVRTAAFVQISARDKYEDGSGHMLIKLLALFPIADSKGKEIDQGSLLRYLAETAWFPSAALSSYITWEQIDSATAKATMSYGGITASGIFTFEAGGDVTSFQAQRYYDRKEGPTLETWLIAMNKDGYREFAGVRIPAKSEVTWKLRSGDFTWLKVEITDLMYNPATDDLPQLDD